MANLQVEKNLLTQEDIAYGEGTVAQIRGGGNYLLNEVRTIMPVNSLDELNALDTTKFLKAILFTTSEAVHYSYYSGAWHADTTLTDAIASLTVETFPALATTPAPTAGMVVYLKQHTSGGLGGGHFQDAAGVVTNDGGTLINNTVTAGRHWKRINYNGLTMQMFGVYAGMSNAGPALQLAVDAASGAAIYDETGGTYIFTSGVVYDTTGLGIVEGCKIIGRGKRKTIFDNRTGGALITLESGTSTSDFQKNAELSGFSIINTTASASTKGMHIEGVFDSCIRDVLVSDQASDGIELYSYVGDATDCYNIEVSYCTLDSNGGDGIKIDAPTSINANININNNTITDNAGFGISAYSLVSSWMCKNAIAYNLLGGVFVGRRTGGNYSKNITIENNEFDSNAGIQLNLGHVFAVSEALNYYVVNEGAPVVTTLLNISADAFNVTSNKISPRIPVSYAGVTAFSIALGTSQIEIKNANWSSWQVAGNTKYSDLGTTTSIFDTNEYITSVRAYGIKFPSASVPSSDINTMDDYESSTWSPPAPTTVNITGTPSFSGGTYTKIGDRVFIDGIFSFTATATTGTEITFELPIPSNPLGFAGIGAALDVNSLASGVVFDPTGGTGTTAKIQFLSLGIGARVVKFSLNYTSN